MNFRSPESQDPLTISIPLVGWLFPPVPPPPGFRLDIFSHALFTLLSSEHQSSLSLNAYSKYTSQHKPRKYGYKEVIFMKFNCFNKEDLIKVVLTTNIQ